MSDEETWERRWIKAIKTIAEREEVIDILKAERDKLEDMWRERPTGTRSQREKQLEKEVEKLKGELEIARAVVPHFYSPGTTQDCSICGTGQFAPQHNIKAEVDRLTQQRDELEVQVKRLLAKEGKRLTTTLTNQNGDRG